jgi:IS5 family transposase
MTKLRIYCLQQCYDLSDPGAEATFYDSESMRRFAGIELGEEHRPTPCVVRDVKPVDGAPAFARRRRVSARGRWESNGNSH